MCADKDVCASYRGGKSLAHLKRGKRNEKRGKEKLVKGSALIAEASRSHEKVKVI